MLALSPAARKRTHIAGLLCVFYGFAMLLANSYVMAHLVPVRQIQKVPSQSISAKHGGHRRPVKKNPEIASQPHVAPKIEQPVPRTDSGVISDLGIKPVRMDIPQPAHPHVPLWAVPGEYSPAELEACARAGRPGCKDPKPPVQPANPFDIYGSLNRQQNNATRSVTIPAIHAYGGTDQQAPSPPDKKPEQQ